MTAEFDRASELLLQFNQEELARVAAFLSGWDPAAFVSVAEAYLSARAHGAADPAERAEVGQ